MLSPPIATVGFIDEYCLLYRSMFEDVRLYECFKAVSEKDITAQTRT